VEDDWLSCTGEWQDGRGPVGSFSLFVLFRR
jgi:hypothetical protein